MQFDYTIEVFSTVSITAGDVDDDDDVDDDVNDDENTVFI